MRYACKKEISLVLLVTLFALYVTACTTSKGYGESRSNSAEQKSTKPKEPNSGMPNMDMPSKVSAKRENEVNTAPNQVVIENFSFVPATLTVKTGTKVTWINRDDVPHTATDTDKRFNSKTLDTDDQFSFTFEQPGTYSYYCALHPKMTAQIIVK